MKEPTKPNTTSAMDNYKHQDQPTMEDTDEKIKTTDHQPEEHNYDTDNLPPLTDSEYSIDSSDDKWSNNTPSTSKLETIQGRKTKISCGHCDMVCKEN